MLKLIDLKYEPIQVSSHILDKTLVDEIYLPLPKDIKLKVQKNSSILINENLSLNYSLSSPISGSVLTVKAINTLEGPKPALIIKNNYQEKYFKVPKTKKIRHLNMSEMNSIFNLLNLNFENKNKLIINAIDDEAYVYTQNYYLFLNYEDFLELLDRITAIYNIEVMICVKESSQENINNLLAYLGMYPKVKLNVLPSLYLLGNNECLQAYLEETQSLVIKASQLYEIYNYLRKGEAPKDQLITLSGSIVLNPTIVKVLKYSSLSSLLKDIKLKDNSYDIIANGLMQGQKININDYIITSDIESIILVPPQKNYVEKRCLNCGACLNICPLNLNPLLFKDPNYLAKIKSKCLKCNLCSYICPSYIDFSKYFKEE